MKAVEPPLCATIHEPTTAAARARIEAVAPHVGLLELRLDAAPSAAPHDLPALLTAAPCPVLVTCRPPREGGGWDGSEADRLALLRRAIELGVAWVDVERDAVDALLASGPFPAARLVVSRHPPAAPASAFPRLLAELRHPGAAVTKLALPVADAADALALLRHAAAEPQPTLAIAMGFPGVVTRLAGPRAGAPWVYVTADPDRPAAPGQLPAPLARQLLGARGRTPDAELFGVLGRPVAHSRSPALMNAAFARLGVEAIYSWLETADVAALLAEAARDPGFAGCSVTIPHKLAAARAPGVAPAPEVEALGALNTLVRTGPESWSGHNTDALAAEALLARAQARLDVVAPPPLALLGSGGAARAVAWAAARRGHPTQVFARTPARAEALVAALTAAVPGARLTVAGALTDLPPAGDAPRLIVNATPVGMHTADDPQATERSPADPAAFGPTTCAYDLVYTPVETRFLQDARARGAQVVTGLEHFTAQARAQLALWLGDDAVAPLTDAWLAEQALGD